MTDTFYDSLASHYHLIFQDWDESMRRQGDTLAKLLPQPDSAGRILDCSCGIGTQALALAALGYAVEGSDLSVAEIERARREAAQRGLDVAFRIDDMRTLDKAPVGGYGAVLTLDNALAHLDSDEQLATCLGSVRRRLRHGGTFLASVRDYGHHQRERTAVTPPMLFDDGGRRRVVVQVWDWQDERRYTAHLYITQETGSGWQTHHFAGRLRAVTSAEIAVLAERAGFRAVTVLPPDETGFYQPVIKATA